MEANFSMAEPRGGPWMGERCFVGSLTGVLLGSGWVRMASAEGLWCDGMAVLEVGKPYIAGRTSIATRAEYNFSSGQHELLVCFSHLSEDEITAVRTGEAEFGLLIFGLVILFLYRFGEAIAWRDAPYSWHLVPANERQLPGAPATAETRALLCVVLVDADSNIVRALRALTFSPEFTSALHTAITEQAEERWDPGEFDAQLRRACQCWPTRLRSHMGVPD